MRVASGERLVTEVAMVKNTAGIGGGTTEIMNKIIAEQLGA
ncbi:hypothetical protein [Dactylosporangium sp. NPDC051484]